MATFPNINIFGYTLLPGTEFYARREEYRIEAIPVAGYGKAKGEYVVGCHSFSRDHGEEGYFLITAHILLVHGHIMPLTTRLLALREEVPVSPLLRALLRTVLTLVSRDLNGLDLTDRMSIYEQRDRIYLAALARRDQLYAMVADTLEQHFHNYDRDPREALQALQLDAALCPREGEEHSLPVDFGFDALAAHRALTAMELPAPAENNTPQQALKIHHPGGVGEILLSADGGSWLGGSIEEPAVNNHPAHELEKPSELAFVAIA